MGRDDGYGPDSGPARSADTELAHADWAFSQSPIAFATFDRELRFRRASAATRRLIGLPEDGIRGRRLDELLSAPQYADFTARLRQVIATGRWTYFEHRVPAPLSGHEQCWSTWIWPLRDPSGTVVGAAAASFDNSEQHRSRERLALLNEAGAAIGTTLDVGQTARELAQVAVPRLADFVSVDLIDAVLQGEEPEPGLIDSPVVMRRMAHRSHHEGTPEAAITLGALDVYPRFSPPAQALATGRPVIVDSEDPRFRNWVTANRARAAKAGWERHKFSLMAVPLRARGTSLGVAVFVRVRRYLELFTEDDAVLAEELARRAAVCVDNARRYSREHATALALQRSLLPQTLPGQAAVEAAFRYQPAGTRAGVGGDWFDVIPLSGTRVALVVGDVVGHGIHASATMGRLRTAVRTLADVDLPPDELLTHLDDLVSHLSADEYGAAAGVPPEAAGYVGATCLYAVYDPVSRRVSAASAGHPSPVLLFPDGAVRVLDIAAGPPLGVGGLPFEATERELPEGSLLALYTDGLLEARDRDLDAGLEQLCRALTTAGNRSPEATCDTVLKTLLPQRPVDDAALLVARTRALHADQVAFWDLACEPAVVAEARARASAQLTAWGLEELAFVTELVVSELVTNAIRYAEPPVQLRLIRDRTLICEVADGSSTAPHLRRARIFDEGGRGLLLVAQLTQRWGTRQTAAGKTIWAELALPAR